MGIVTETSAELAEFVQKMGESVAEAKRQIDRASIEALQQLAEVPVTIPVITKELHDGEVKHKIENITVSPLSLGMMPTFYEFSKTEIEVSMDFEISEDLTENNSARRKERGGFGKIKKLGVNTRRVRQERKIKSDLKGFSSLKIEMVPVPPPASLPELVVDNTHLPAIDKSPAPESS